MSYGEKIITGTSTVFLMHILGGASAYILRLFLARNLTLEEFGLFYAVLYFVGFLTIFRDLGFGPTLTKYIAEFSAKNDNKSIKSSVIIVLMIELLAGIVLASIVFLFSDQLSDFYFKAAATDVLLVIVLSFVISSFVILQYVFQGLGKIKQYAIIEPVRNFFTLLVTVSLIGFGIIGAAYGYLIASVMISIIIFLMMLRVFPFFSIKAKISKELSKRIFLFSLPVFFTGIGGTILVYTDNLVITYFLSLRDVGLYNAALPTSQLLWVLVGSITVALLPVVSYLHAKNDKNTLSKIIGLLVKFSFIATIPFVLIVMSFPDVVIKILFGDGYVGAAPTLQVLALTSLFYSTFSIMYTSILGVGKPSINVKVISFIAVIDLILNIVFVPTMGIIGAAITTLVSYFIGTVISVKYMKKEIDFRFYWKDMVKSFLCGLAVFVLIFYLKVFVKAEPVIEAAIASFMGIAAYVALLYATRSIKKDEITLLKKSGVPVPIFFIKLFDRL